MQFPGIGRAAAQNRIQSVQVPRQQPILVAGDKAIMKLLSDSTQIHHHLPGRYAGNQSAD
jgi:hypothetical protein